MLIDLKMLLEKMILIRSVEETLLKLHSLGLLRGTVHTCIGQEGCAVGVMSAIRVEKDIVFSNHRGHGHYLMYCEDVHGLIAEIMGLECGVCSGIGGSQHLQRLNFYTNGIQGAGVPIAVGMGFAEKLIGSDAIAVVFIGDGTFGEGVVYEAFNLASLWKSPTLFVVEDNHYAQSTPSFMQHAGCLAERAQSFGIKVTRGDGANVEDVYKITLKIVEEISTTKIPQLLYLDTYRFAPHSKGDDFRDPKELRQMIKERDPIKRAAKNIQADQFAQMEQYVDNLIQDVLEKLGVAE
jgi:TPP-dependent pyruvate/acetoin dehydrogenase alpha subunit